MERKFVRSRQRGSVKRQILTVMLLATLLWLLSNLPKAQAAPIVTGPFTPPPGAAMTTGQTARYKQFGTGTSNNVYLGPNVGSGGSANRVETRVTWNSPGTNSITFQYDKSGDKVVTTVVGLTTVSLTFPAVASSIGYPPRSWNFVAIYIYNRNTNTTVNLNNVYLDTHSLGSLSGGTGASTNIQYWTVTDYDFSQGFTITGTIQLAGTFSGGENCKVEISVGVSPPAVLDHFTFDPIGSPQIAGSPITVTITAMDQYGNRFTSYAGSNTLSDSTGTINPSTTGTLAGGSWTGSITITKARTGVTIATSGSGISGMSNPFDVSSAGSSKIVITAGPSSSIAGAWTSSFTAERQDQYSNSVTSGTTIVYLSSTSTGANQEFAEMPYGPAVSSATIPDGSSTKDFYYHDEKAGSWTISVSAIGLTGDSKSLTVNPGSLTSFTMTGYPSSVTAGQSFSITITAVDAYGNTVTGHTGPNSLSDLTGTISPISTGSFVDGVWSGDVTITRTHSGNTISTSGDGKSSTSDSFTVNPGSLNSFSFSTISSPQTVGESFSITITAEDAYGNTVTSYVGTNSLSASVGSVSPISTEAFSSGVWTGSVTPDTADSGVTISTSGSDKTGISNSFTVLTVGAHSIIMNAISPQYYQSDATVSYSGSTADGASGVSIAILVKDSAGSTIFTDQVTTKNDGAFSGSFTLDLGVEGQDTITASADGYTSASRTFFADFTMPTSSMSSPANGASVNGALAQISGDASDPVLGDGNAGSGAASVSITIKRNADNAFWTGTGWDTQTSLATNFLSGTWTFDSSAVTWSLGTFTVSSTTTDRAGNVQGSPSSSQFTICLKVTMTVSYQVIGGGTGYSAPTFDYVQDGLPHDYVLTETPTDLQVDDGSGWSVTPNPLDGSAPSPTEQWYADPATLIGTASTSTHVFSFQHQYQLTVTSIPSEEKTDPTGRNWYDSGTVVTITALKNTGYGFINWTGSGSGEYTGSLNPVNVTMNGPVSETATFTFEPITEFLLTPIYHHVNVTWAGSADGWDLYWSLTPDMSDKVLLKSLPGIPLVYMTHSPPPSTWNSTVYYQLIPLINGTEQPSVAVVDSTTVLPFPVEKMSVNVLASNTDEIKVRLNYQSVNDGGITTGVQIGEILTSDSTPTPIAIFTTAPVNLPSYHSTGYYIIDYTPTTPLAPGHYQVWFFLWKQLPGENGEFETYMVKVVVTVTVQ